MLLLAILTYHLAYHSGAIGVKVAYHAVVDQSGFGKITSGTVTIQNGTRRFAVNLGSLLPLTSQNVLLPTGVRDGCGLSQPLAVKSHYVVVEAVWVGKGCLPVPYFIDADSGLRAETVDLDHRWDHRLDIQAVHFEGKPIRVEHVDHVTLALVTYDQKVTGSSPWLFVIVKGRDMKDNARLYAYSYAHVHLNNRPDPGWNIFPTLGSVVEIGPLTGLYVYSYHPDADVLRLSAADDANYTERQEPTSSHDARALERNQWMIVMGEDVQAFQFPQALTAFDKVLSLEDDQSLYPGEKAMYNDCRAMVAQLQAGKISAASARTRWETKGCRP